MNQEHMNAILDVALTYGCDLLQRDNKFFPYAATLEKDGSVQRSESIDVDSSDEDPEKIFEQMCQTLKRDVMEGLYLGYGVGLDVKVKRSPTEDYTKAVHVYIYHQDGTAFECYLPYSKAVDGNYAFGQVWGQPVQ